jgi:hypothetical protein
MALEAERLAVAETIRRELGQANALTPEQARLFVRCLQHSWQVPPIRWSEIESREQLTDARRLLHAAELFRQVEGEGSGAAIECYRRAGEIYEWLARADDALKLALPVALLAAGAYQLGDLPAMAASVLRQAVTKAQAGDLEFDQVANQPEDDEDGEDGDERWAERAADADADGGHADPQGASGRLYSAFFQTDSNFPRESPESRESTPSPDGAAPPQPSLRHRQAGIEATADQERARRRAMRGQWD